MASESWGADTDVSIPVPWKKSLPLKVDFGGFGFTAGGICHALTDAERDGLIRPTFSPREYQPGAVVRGG